MRKDTIPRLALKRVCYILFRTWTEWWLNIRPSYKASYQIGTKSTNIWSKKKERAEKVKKGKEKFHSLWKQKKKSMPCFPFPGRSTPCKGLWAGPIFGILQLETVDCETLHLFTPKTDKACLRDLCRANCFAREAQDIVWDFCTWGWMNLQLS